MKEVFEKLELAVRRTRERMMHYPVEVRTLLDNLGEEILRLAMEESGGLQVDE